MASLWLRNLWHTLRGYDNVRDGPSADVKIDVNGSEHRGGTNVPVILLGLCLLGMVLSCYMVWEFYHPLTKAFCDMSEGVSCTKLVLLGWASLFGVPISVLGLFWFITMFVAETYSLLRKDILLFVFLWALGGALFIIYLVSVEVYVGTICPVCTVVHVLLGVVLSFATYQYWRNKGRPDLSSLPGLAWAQLPQLLTKEPRFIVAMVILNLIPLISFNTIPALIGSGDGWTLKMKSSLAQCVHKKHIVIYTKAGCPYCIWQKTLFGPAIDQLQGDIRVCTDPQEQPHCTAINIIGYPTWVMYSEHGKEVKRHLGEMPLDEVDEWAGCDVHKAAPPVQP